MKHHILPLACLTAIGVSACAALVQAAWTPPSRDVAALKPATYRVEPGHTQVTFGVMHLGLTMYHGSFSGASGSLAFTPADPARMALSVSVPVASVLTTSPKLDGELKSPAWLDATQYPAMTFQSVTVTRTGADSADVAGTLTLHGVAKPVVLHAVFNGAGINPLSGRENLGFSVTGIISRSAFGVDKYVPLVSDQVTLTISGAFEA